MIGKAKTAKKMIKKEGLKYTIKFSLDKMKIRKLFPVTGFYKDNGVKIKPKRLLDKYISNESNQERKEGGIVKCHQKLTKKGDNVLVIGGGNGVTGVRSAKIVGDEGKVIIYEGGAKSANKIREIIHLNKVKKICTVKHSVVGQKKDVYGGRTKNASYTSAKELPECDILEMDCEGSEIGIMKKMSIKPRAIISEMHPWNTKYDAEKFVKIFDEVGYDITHAYGHDGIGLNKNEMKKLLRRSKNEEEKYVVSGARWPVVMAGIRSD